MTDAKRRIAIMSLVNQHTVINATNKADAKRTLIAEGIYTKAGKLRTEFGGEPKPKAGV